MGIEYKYYNGNWSQLPDFTTLSPTDSGSVDNLDISVRNDQSNYGFVFTGYIYLDTAGNYTFYTSSDDGSKLFINGDEVVDNDGLHGTRERSGTISLRQGMHAFEVQFFERSGGESLSWKYEGPAISKQSVPDDILFNSDLSSLTYAWTGPGGFSSTDPNPMVNTLGTYYLTVSNADTAISDSMQLLLHSNPVFEAQGAWLACGQDSTEITNNLNGSLYQSGIRYDYYTGNWNNLPDFSTLVPDYSGIETNISLDPRSAEDYFAFVYKGEIYLDTAGTYTFYVSSDDGSKILINDVLLVDNDGLHGNRERSDTITLPVGYHSFEVQFFERSGGANLSTSYAGPGISKTTIPDEVLFYQNENSYSYQWTGPNGLSDSLSQIYVSEAGTYTLSITNETTQCSASDTAYVEYYCVGYQGQVFEDINENSAFDMGELALDSIQVFLLDDLQNLLDSTLSDSTGVFSFPDLRPGSYRFRLANLPDELGLLSGLVGYADQEIGGVRFITTPLEVLNPANNTSLAIPLVRSLTLPVEYLDLQLVEENDYWTLKWATAWEQNNEKFVIERSLDGHLFGAIDEVPSIGNSQVPLSYQYVDKDKAIGNIVDQWYYRIRQVDFDGQFHLSKVLTAKVSGDEIPLEVTGYPNPVTGPEFRVRYSAGGQEAFVEFKIISALGQEVHYQELEKGQLLEFKVDIANWPSGYYYLQINDGDQQSVFKLLKQ